MPVATRLDANVANGRQPLPARHACEHEGWAAGETLRGADAEPLHHARPMALDQHVGALDQHQEALRRAERAEVDVDGAAAAAERMRRGAAARADRSTATRPADLEDVGTVIGQHHPGERTRRSADLDDLQTVERLSHACSTVARSANGPLGAKGGDLLGGVAELQEDLVGVLTQLGRKPMRYLRRVRRAYEHVQFPNVALVGV